MDKTNMVECCLCGCNENLSMYAHRGKFKIVGWVFVCVGCETAFKIGEQTELQISIMRRDKEDEK